MTWIESIKISPYTASLMSLWLPGLELYSPFARHAIFPPRLSDEGVLVLLRGRVSRCVTHIALVSLPRRVRETFVAQRRTTTSALLPCGRVDGGRGSAAGPFPSVPLRTTHECFQLTWLSSSSNALVQPMHITCASPCTAVHLDCFALYVAFPRSLVRHHSHDYYQSSVAISLA